MWLVSRERHRPAGPGGVIPEEDAAALRAAYAGKGDKGQTARAVRLVRDARQFHRWIACDCREAEDVYPLMTPAYLSTACVYYLRRLTGNGRPEHAEACVFQRERPEPGLEPIADRTPSPVKAPTGYFSVLSGDHDPCLAEFAGDSDARRRLAKSPPPLARQLWRLMTQAGLTKLPPVQHSEKPSIRAEFEKLRAAAERVDVAPGVALARVLATHPREYHSSKHFARIRAAHGREDENDPLQGFLLVFVRDVKGKALLFGEGEPVLVAGEVGRPGPGDALSPAPFLALAVVGEHAQASGLTALRAYAQPVYSGAQFLPVESEFERQVLKAVNSARWSLSKSRPRIEISVDKPLFDSPTPDGPCRPDLILDIVDGETGEVHALIIKAMGQANDDYAAAKREAHALMRHLGPILEVVPDDLADPRALALRIAEKISAL